MEKAAFIPFTQAREEAREMVASGRQRSGGVAAVLAAPPPSAAVLSPRKARPPRYGTGGDNDGDSGSSGHSTLYNEVATVATAAASSPCNTWHGKRSLFAALEAMQAEQMQGEQP